MEPGRFGGSSYDGGSYIDESRIFKGDIKTTFKGQRKTIETTGGCDGVLSTFNADGAKQDVIIAQNEIVLRDSNVNELKSADILCFDCPFLGELEATSSIVLKDCDYVNHIKKTFELVLHNSRVLGDVKAHTPKLNQSTIEGTLTSSCQEIKLVSSYVNKLILMKPTPKYSIFSANGEQVKGIPPELAPLVLAVQNGKLSITPNGSGYNVLIGKKTHNINIKFVVGSTKDIEVTSANGHSMKSNIIKAEGITLPLDPLLDKNALKNVLEIVKNAAQNKLLNQNETKPTESKPQVIIVSGGHVEEIIFEIEGGSVVCENGGTAGKITMGALVEKVELVAAEPPENFLDPIYLEIMKNPYRTPLDHVDHVYDFKTLQRLAVDGVFKDPQTRIEYKLSDCKPDIQLQIQINEWLKTHKPV